MTKVSDESRAIVEWEFCNTPITARALWRKYGWDPRGWIRQHGLKKNDKVTFYPPHAEGQARFEAALQAGLAEMKAKNEVLLMEKRLKSDEKAKALHSSRKLPEPKPKPPPKSEPKPKPTRKKWLKAPISDKVEEVDTLLPTAITGKVVPFPTKFIPPPPEMDRSQARAVIPERTKEERAAMRQRLALLKHEISLNQLEQLEAHDDVIADYRHLLACYVNPRRFVDVAKLNDDEAQEKLTAVSQAALRLLLPTERDTLAGAILALNKATLSSIAAARAIMSIGPARANKGLTPDRDDEDGAAPEGEKRVDKLDLGSLRSVKHAMELLTGYQQEQNEPPVPPPPEGLDDLVVERGEDSPPPAG